MSRPPAVPGSRIQQRGDPPAGNGDAAGCGTVRHGLHDGNDLADILRETGTREPAPYSGRAHPGRPGQGTVRRITAQLRVPELMQRRQQRKEPVLRRPARAHDPPGDYLSMASSLMRQTPRA